MGRPLALGCLIAWLLTTALWLWDVAGGGAPRSLCQVVLELTLLLSLLGCLWLATQLWDRRGNGQPGSGDRALLVLVVLSLIIHWVGVDFEVSGRYYRDEGIYYAAALEINQGELLPESFIYGHLPYYIYALALWVQSMFPALFAWLAGLLFGVSKEVEVSWLMLRGIDTTFGALTAVPVFVIGRRVAGPAAGLLGAALIIFSPLYNEITRLIISDVPSAFFAALSLMFAARLLERERWSDYLLAGAAAGLAAACKYPAGVVAVAIVALWLGWRLRQRDWSWHLVGAGAAAVATFVAVMPAFLAYPEAIFVGQGKDLLFGLRQYGRGGWIGVMPSSNPLWYGGQLLKSFGAPAVLLGLLGWFWLEPPARGRFLKMLPFPVVYLALLVAMSMVVKRNLLPVLPAIAALLGAGVAGWISRLERRLPGPTVRWASLVLVASLAVPVYRTLMQTVAFSRPSTREAAATWIDTHLPRGTTLIKESYTPHLHHKKYTVRQTRFAARIPLADLRSGEWDYLLLARNAYGRFLNPENWAKPHHEIYADRYQEMLRFELVREFVPDRARLGPTLQLFAVDPPEVEYRRGYRYAFEGEGFRYPRDDAFLLLKGYLAPARYRFLLDTVPASVEGRIHVVSRDGRQVGELAVLASEAVGELPWRAKYFFYIYLPKDTEIRAMSLEPLGAGDP